MDRRADRHMERSFPYLSPDFVLRPAAIGHDALERRCAKLGESGITGGLDMRQALQQPMQEFHIITGARRYLSCAQSKGPRRELWGVNRKTLGDSGQRV